MAGAGFKDFSIGEVLTSADVDQYLMQQSVMRFADSAARGSALGTAVGTAVPLAEGMVAYLDDGNVVQVFNGSAWVGVGGFDASATITATDSAWPVPSLGSPIVKVTVIGGGGGGGLSTAGGDGGTTTFNAGSGPLTLTASGGSGGNQYGTVTGKAGTAGLSAGNGGMAGGDIFVTGGDVFWREGQPGNGGSVTVGYLDLTGVSAVNITIGSGGSASSGAGAGGRGEVIVEYKAV